MQFQLDHITVYLREAENALHLKTELENWSIPHQTAAETREVLERNYKIVKAHFMPKAGEAISAYDLGNVCLRITLHYFQTANHTRSMHKQESDLSFDPRDFAHPFTAHDIVNYFRKMYPDSYAEKCEILLELTPDQFRDMEFRKDQFDEK